jgi:hypothetical protein
MSPDPRRAADRLARQAAATAKLGQDRQRAQRASGPAYIVFADRATADAVLQEIAATPELADGLAWPVLVWDDAAGAAIGTFEAPDGRVAVGHRWAAAERAWLGDYVAAWRAKVQVLDALPGDWQSPGAGKRGRGGA